MSFNLRDTLNCIDHRYATTVKRTEIPRAFFEYFSLERILLPKAHPVQSGVGKSSTSSHRRERAGMTQLLSYLELSAKALLPGQIESPTYLNTCP